MVRRAIIQRSNFSSVDVVARYLPTNYKVVGEDERGIIIEGKDVAGWTLDDYVLPRLASGLIWGKEIDA
jgi:hypothetical protein